MSEIHVAPLESELLCRNRVHLFSLDLRKRAAVSRVLGDYLLLYRNVHRRGYDLVDVPHCFRTQSLRLILRLDSVYAPLREKRFVHPLKLQARQLVERHVTDVRLYVVLDVTLHLRCSS